MMRAEELLSFRCIMVMDEVCMYCESSKISILLKCPVPIECDLQKVSSRTSELSDLRYLLTMQFTNTQTQVKDSN